MAKIVLHKTDKDEGKSGGCVFKQGHVERELPIGEKGVLTIDI